MFTRCPKCGHHPLPADQALPAACPACSVILAKVAQARGDEAGGTSDKAARPRAGSRAALYASAGTGDDDSHDIYQGLAGLMLHVPDRVDVTRWRLRIGLLAFFALWGLRLIWADYRTGEMGE